MPVFATGFQSVFCADFRSIRGLSGKRWRWLGLFLFGWGMLRSFDGSGVRWLELRRGFSPFSLSLALGQGGLLLRLRPVVLDRMVRWWAGIVVVPGESGVGPTASTSFCFSCIHALWFGGHRVLSGLDSLVVSHFSSPSMAKEPVRVLVTGAAGQIGYALVPMIARGVMLGPDQPVILHMLDIPPAAEALNGVKMELVDAAFPLLKGVVATTDPVEACTGVNVAVMVGGFPRKEGMERKDVMSKNVSIYKSQASALEKHAAANCKVLVVANPANTNALILKEFAPSIPEKNITCLTRLDHNRALGQISERLNVQVSDVKNVIIWGNHSSTQYPDVNHATVKTPAGEKPVRELVADDTWLNSEFITTVQQRGAAIIKARKFSSALSAASSACDHIRDWVLGTPEGTWVSMGVYSDGSYNVPAGLIYSFPVICKNGEWSIVQGLSIDEFSRKKLDLTAQELSEEKALACSCLS
ncbi:Malate dehydrogenase- cytoplasmic 2 [Striga hermonthica]|uniref:malate dehydrogenase n=2 Tax=Magnoliopsida TaxID=3398 RepID=A0A9N7MKW3_STRHE|nr:Malate dehydrogenase- cytoplasmic 2 [Striga hermonthica]